MRREPLRVQKALSHPPRGKRGVEDGAGRKGLLAVFLITTDQEGSPHRRHAPEIAVRVASGGGINASFSERRQDRLDFGTQESNVVRKGASRHGAIRIPQTPAGR
jgi:hypothetical protein